MAFRPFTLTWKGRDYHVPANQIMGLLATVEDVLTLSELQVFAKRGAAPLSKISTAYAAALTYAGVQVEGAEVLVRAAHHDPDGTADKITRLLMLAFVDAPPAPEAPTEGNAPKAAGASSKPRTKAPSPAASG